MVHKTGVHKCPECPKTFSRLEYVARHQRVKHLGIRTWSCACGASYGRSDLLSRHKRKCKAKESKDSTHDKNCIDSQQDNNRPSAASVVLSSDPSSIHPAASTSHHPSNYDDKEPPTYLEAISQKGPFTFHLSDPADNLHIHPTSASLDLSIRAPTPTSQSDCRPVEEAPTFVPTPAFRSGVDEFSGFIPGDDPSFEDDGGENTRGEDEDAGSNQADDPSGLDSSTSIVPVVRYSNPNFFISDVPRSSPFYLNPHIWVLAFMCQKSQGFTIPHLGSLSRYLSRATEVICPVIPMIHVPTLRAPHISIHLGYALSVAGAALENSEHAQAFTDQSLSYKRTSVQNDFVSRDPSFSFRFELFQALITYQFLGMFSRLQVQRDRALRFSPTIIRNFRELACTEIVRNTPDYIQLALSGQIPLDTAWRLWVQYEVQKRTVFLVLISSLQLRGPYGCEVQLSEANVRLPCHEELWTAGSAEGWAEAARRQAMCCWLDNLESEGEKEVCNSYKPTLRHMQDVVGEQAMPLLSDALAALNLSAASSHGSLNSPYPIPDIHRVGASRLTVRAERLGRFAKTVILHARALSNQAAVTIPPLEPPELNI